MLFSTLLSAASSFVALLLIAYLTVVFIWRMPGGKPPMSPKSVWGDTAPHSLSADLRALKRWTLRLLQHRIVLASGLLGLLLLAMLAGGFFVGRLVEADFSHAGQPVHTKTVLAYQLWQDTGVQLKQGQRVFIWARGEWTNQLGGTSFGPDGGSRLDGGTILPKAPIGVLIGRMGEAAPFMVGSSTILTPTSSGPLQLTMNDWPDDRKESGGSVQARITILDP